mmetsp:Transcript_17577/g.57642  ORF Transcript_17577/g.57642 Transcript_17577/m.57642 type:complete len:243 (-) Transcript_17577:14-742(-)
MELHTISRANTPRLRSPPLLAFSAPVHPARSMERTSHAHKKWPATPLASAGTGCTVGTCGIAAAAAAASAPPVGTTAPRLHSSWRTGRFRGSVDGAAASYRARCSLAMIRAARSEPPPTWWSPKKICGIDVTPGGTSCRTSSSRSGWCVTEISVYSHPSISKSRFAALQGSQVSSEKMVTRGALGAAGGAANGPQRGARRREQASCGSGGATIGEEKARSEQWSASTAILPPSTVHRAASAR